MKKLLLPSLLSLSVLLSAQSDLKSIFKASRQFSEIVANGEAYFRDKHPDIPFYELTIGEHRDGEFVKFMRWRKFWSERLNEDGTLGDPSAYWRRQSREGSSRTPTNPYSNVAWTNISYENYITTQIGLGRTTSMAFHPSDAGTFYVGAAIGGIWKTTDGGQSYTPLGDALPFMPVSSIVVDQQNPNTLYIAVSDHVWYGPGSIGVYKSTNGGANWSPTALTIDIANDVRIYWMEADPNAPNTILAATENGLYRTTDGFATYSSVSSGGTFSVRYMPGNSNVVYAGKTNGAFLKSTDGGSTFTQITDFGSGNVLVEVTAQNTQKVFCRNGSTLHKSFDAGSTFPQSNVFTTSSEVFSFAPADEDIIISGNFECYRSDNGGTTFSVITHWLGNNSLPLIHVDQRNMFTNPLEPDEVYLCNDGGVYRYTVSSGVFTNLSDGLLITQFYDIAVAQTDPDVIGGGSQDNGNVFREAGGTWSQYAGTGDGMNQEIDPTNDGIRYWAYQNGGMRRWENGTNTNISPPGLNGNGAWETPFKLDPSDADRLICGYDAVYESLDNGDNWAAISNQFGGNLNELAIAPTNGERIYATNGGTLYVKNINDDNWTTKSLPNGGVSDIEVDFQNPDIVYVSVPGYSNGQKIYKSTDAGTSWINITGSLPNISVGALEMYEGTAGGVFIGSDAGVYYRDNDLTDWLEYGALPHTRVEDIEIQYSAQLIRVGTHGRGVLEAPIIVEACTPASPDSDNDGFCDFIDLCPGFDNTLIGEYCDDSDEFSEGEIYTSACLCEGGAAFLSYCSAAGSAGTGSDYINRVQLGAIDNSSGKTMYSDFRTTSTRMDHGEDYPIAVRLQATFSIDRVHVWIDYDRSGSFETTEAVPMGIAVSNISSGTVSVPLNAVKGATTMRVRVVYSETFDDPCGNAFGEVEDYTVFLDCVPGSTHGQCTLLPLEWLEFSVKPGGEGTAVLLWKTGYETDIDYFVIERSFDGRVFTSIGQQASLGNSQEETAYNFIDEEVKGAEAYYRIKAVDLDGTVSYSTVRSVNWQTSNGLEVTLYPNPATSVLYLSLATTNLSELSWDIQNLQGQVLQQGNYPTPITAEILELPLANLPAGAYLLRLRSPKGESKLTFVKE